MSLKFFILIVCICVCECTLFKKPTIQHRQILERLRSKVNFLNHQIEPSKLASEGCMDQANYEEHCLTEECIHLSSSILSKIDRLTDPCHDFFRFSCGKWQERNVLKIGDTNLYYASNMNEMPEEVDNVLKGLLSKKLKIYDGFYQTRPYRDLNYFHQSCLNVEVIQSEGFGPAATHLKSLKEFFVGRPFDKNSFDLTEAVLEMLRHNGAPLFDISIDSQLHNSSRWGLVITTPKHYGLIQSLVAPKFRKKRKPGVQEIFRSKGRKFLKRLLKELENNFFVLELLSNIHKGKWSKANEKNPNNIKADSNLVDQFSNWESKPNNRLSFYSKIIDAESKNKIVDDFSGNKKVNKVKENYVDTQKLTQLDYKANFINLNQQSTDDDNTSTPPPESFNIGEGNITDLKLFISFLDENMIANINKTFFTNIMENDNFFENISGIMLPAIVENLKNIDDEKVMTILDNLFNDSEGSGDEYLSFGDDMESQKQAIELVQLMGLLPSISRKDLYAEIQNDVKNDRSNKLSRILRSSEFKELLNLDEIAVTQNMTPDVTSDVESKLLDEILNFVTELRDLEPTERQDMLLVQNGLVYNPITIKDLNENTPFINWHHALSTLVNMTLTDDDIVQVYYINYMKELSNLLSKTEPWVIHHSMLLLYMTDVLNELISLDENEAREDFCFSVTKETMSDVLSHMYLHYNGPHKLQELKDEMLPMTEATTRTAIELILKNSWMTSPDKVAAIAKLKKMDWQIGGSEKHLDIRYVNDIHEGMELKDQHFLKNVFNLYTMYRMMLYDFYSKNVDEQQLIWSFTAQPYTINAFHLQSTNSIVMPEAFFRPPYYSFGAPLYVNYGSAGMAFAHEMVHALDLTGSLFDGDGAITKPFSSDLAKNLRKKIGCFNDMVQSTFFEVAKIEGLNVDMEIDNNGTQNENIADISGLNFAYNTFKNQAKDGNPEPTLPGMSFTREQLFFIGFAQPYCAILPPIAKVILMEIDEHLPHDIRVNSLLMNSPDFAKAFQCKSGDRMFKEETCPIF